MAPCPVFNTFFTISFQKNFCERAVLVTEKKRAAMSISHESQYMTFLIRETPLGRM